MGPLKWTVHLSILTGHRPVKLQPLQNTISFLVQFMILAVLRPTCVASAANSAPNHFRRCGLCSEHPYHLIGSCVLWSEQYMLIYFLNLAYFRDFNLKRKISASRMVSPMSIELLMTVLLVESNVFVKSEDTFVIYTTGIFCFTAGCSLPFRFHTVKHFGRFLIVFLSKNV